MRFTCVLPLAASPAITNAAEARKSLAITGAPLNFAPPFTIALGPSIEISAPSRANSLTCMKRDSCMRSEEHTSELQSLRHLVCRLLLEKKKKNKKTTKQEIRTHLIYNN